MTFVSPLQGPSYVYCCYIKTQKKYAQPKRFKVLDIETTIMTLNFRTDRSGQTVQTRIRLLKEQSDQGLHCLLFLLHLLN